MTDAREIIRVKRDGGELTEGQIRDFLTGYVAGDIADYQASALLMGIFVRGMTDDELAHWTRAMLESGDVFRFDGLDRPPADKHSTGGVGDKVSIPLAPAVAACGVAVPMVSGRGLGHTGGTLDKLESIPGFRTNLDEADFQRCLERTGCALGGQTATLVPADGKLYALRDVTGLIESIPLIASSILSKKLAEGIDALVLDVKYGSGAFLADRRQGAELGRTMVRLAGQMGLRSTAYQTCMERPLGRAIGHSIEIEESIDCLRGAGPPDLRELVCLLGGEMLAMVGRADDPADGHDRISRALDTGAAMEVFRRVVMEQGGDPRCLDDPTHLPAAPDREVFRAPSGGQLAYGDVRELGLACVALGGGRRALDDAIDPGVGLRVLRRAGEEVDAGDELFEILHRGGHGLVEARTHLERALTIGEPAELPPLVLARLEA